jgi:hypothetical protein
MKNLIGNLKRPLFSGRLLLGYKPQHIFLKLLFAQLDQTMTHAKTDAFLGVGNELSHFTQHGGRVEDIRAAAGEDSQRVSACANAHKWQAVVGMGSFERREGPHLLFPVLRCFCQVFLNPEGDDLANQVIGHGFFQRKFN